MIGGIYMFIRNKGKWISTFALTTLLLVACTEEEAEKPAVTNDSETETAQTQQVESQVIIQADTINSHFQADAICVVDSRFERGHKLVFRANVLDLASNTTLEDAKVKAVLATGDEFEMKIGPHGEEGTLLWTVLWDIPQDFPTGTLDYKIVAEVDGEEYTYQPFDVSLSKLTILEQGAEAALTEEAAAAAEGDA